MEARPVSQINNPVKAPEFELWSVKIRPATKERLKAFAQTNEFSMQDILDAALLDYMDTFEKIREPKTHPDICGGCGAEYELAEGHECYAAGSFAGSVPE